MAGVTITAGAMSLLEEGADATLVLQLGPNLWRVQECKAQAPEVERHPLWASHRSRNMGVDGDPTMNWIMDLWCRMFHHNTMWPMHGKYICPDCLREFPCGWETVQLKQLKEEYGKEV